MKFLWLKNAGRKILSSLMVILLLVFIPSMILSAGYQEEKLFDKNVYSAEELKAKIEAHKKEIKVLDEQIKALEQDIDWLVLKINQIQDSGRTAPAELKASIVKKEKKVVTLLKTKNRLEYLVQYYSAGSDAAKDTSLEQIVQSRLQQKAAAGKTAAKIEVQKISPGPMMPVMRPTAKGDLDPYDGVSKAELQTAITKAGLGDWVEIVGTGTCLRLETTLPILFPTGSANIAAEYKTFFKKLASFLKPYDVKVFVSGYADKVPISTKKYPSNFELGATRAANIVHEFVSHGLKPSIFRIESTGKYRFAAKGVSKQKALERRAEVTVVFSG